MACSAPACVESRVLPAEGATLPANLPGFPFADGFGAVEGGDAGASSLVLRKAGQIVDTHLVPIQRTDPFHPFSAFTHVLVPNAPLEAGTYTLDFDKRCAAGAAPTQTLTLTEAKTWPSTLGTLRAAPLPTGIVKLAMGAACVEEVRAAAVRLELKRSAEMEAFAPAGIYEVKVDGVAWRGAVGTDESIGAVETLDPFLVFALCPGSGLQGSLAEGAHTAEVRLIFDGAETQVPALTTSFELHCDALQPDAGTPVSGSTSGAAPEASSGSVPSEGSSCAIGGGSVSALGLGLIPLALLARGARRRRTS